MTTLRPQLVRADTIDLQNHHAPSAKDHTRQPTHPAPYGTGPAAPHQNQALRDAEQQTLHEQKYTPQVFEDHLREDYPDEPDFYDDHDDMLHAGHSEQNGQFHGEHGQGSSADDHGIDEQTDDDSLDDDLMDKISSSPSIDDGKYALPVAWPLRKDSVPVGGTYSLVSLPIRGAQNPSSLSASTPDHFALSICKEEDSEWGNHHQGGYVNLDPERPWRTSAAGPHDPPLDRDDSHRKGARTLDYHESQYDDECNGDVGVHDIGRFMLPIDEPVLDNIFDDALETNDDDSDWEDEEENVLYRLDTSSDDDTGDFQFTHDPRFLDSGWGGECLREIEDIDFEFVYALHTFVATVEGQANASKGDTMVLLDDSNSYWWLVRVVKDGSIGYLPAEHIETPTERLARLNKHRNIDLSTTMLGDNAEKSKNPLKKAMRRRNAKTVQFAAPQYFEPSDFDYSDEEEGQEGLPEQGADITDTVNQEPQREHHIDAAAVAPNTINSPQAALVTNGIQKVESNDSVAINEQSSPDKARWDEAHMSERGDESNPRSRNGVVRSTDSFFRDDGIETKKISLTPRLLRGDSYVNVNATQTDAGEAPKLDTFDKPAAQENDRLRDDKKKREKKSMFGIFKRKDKKTKGHEIDVEENEKSSEDSSRLSPQLREPTESQDLRSVKATQAPGRQPSKLQKAPRATLQPRITASQENLQQKEPSPAPPIDPNKTAQAQKNASSASQHVPSVQASALHTDNIAQVKSPVTLQERSTSSPTEKKPIFNPLTATIQSAPSPSEASEQAESQPPVQAMYERKAKGQVAIDESDSKNAKTPSADQHPNPSITHSGPEAISQEDWERLSESPVRVSPVKEADDPFDQPASRPPGLVIDTSSTSGPPSVSARSPSRSTSPSLVDANTANIVDQPKSHTGPSPLTEVHTPSTARSTPSWSDASLRRYMDNDDGIRDLLIIVHDKSNVTPVGPDHPITANLFGAEKGRLAEMQSHLDSLLTGWLARKNGGRLPA